MILDEFGKPIRPEYMDDRQVAFVAACPGIAEEFYESLRKSQAHYEQFSGSRLFSADGERINTGKPMPCGSKPFRVPFRYVSG